MLASPAQQPRPSELLVTLGGGLGDRVIKAAELLDHRQARIILITGVWREQVIDRFKSYDPRIEYLEKRGISRDRIYIDAEADSTWKEALLVRRFMLEHGLNSVIVVSDPPHMRRLAWVYGKVFGDTRVEYCLVASGPPWWDAKYWWSNAESGRFVLKEIGKVIYYWLKYERYGRN